MRLSNRFAYGYGHVTLFSPPQQGGSGGVGLLGGEAEEVARVEVHCIPEAELEYEGTLRRLLRPRKDNERDEGVANVDVSDAQGQEGESAEGRRPAVCLLLSWKEPWTFLYRTRRWLHLFSRSLLPADAPKDESPLDILKEYGFKIMVVLQHVEAQEALERENYKEENFDYISQCLRTCLLPANAALVYTPSSAPPQQPGSPLTEIEKVLYTSLGLDVGALQPKPSSSGGVRKDDMPVPKHNVVDRMAIVVPSGWDSVGKIRLLSETFSPEAVLEGWMTDLTVSSFAPPLPSQQELESERVNGTQQLEDGQAGAGAEVYESSNQPSPLAQSPIDDRPMSPSKMAKSAISSYEQAIQDPNVHKAPKSPQIEVTTRPEQQFLAEMKGALQQYEQQDAERQRTNPNLVSTTAGALTGGRGSIGGGTESGGALSELGDVSFNVGGVSYNTVSAEAAIERLKRPSQAGAESPTVTTPRASTPRPPRRDAGSSGGGEKSDSTPSAPTPSTLGNKDMPIEKLEEYFASLMKRGGGGSASGTPSKQP